MGYMKREEHPELEEEFKKVDASFLDEYKEFENDLVVSEEEWNQLFEILDSFEKDEDKPLYTLGKCSGSGTYLVRRVIDYKNPKPDGFFYALLFRDLGSERAGAMFSKQAMDLTQSFEFSAYVFLGNRFGGEYGTGDGLSLLLTNDSRLETSERSQVVGLPGEFLGAITWGDSSGVPDPNFKERYIDRGMMVELDTYDNDKDSDQYYKSKGTGHVAWRKIQTARVKGGGKPNYFLHNDHQAPDFHLVGNRWDELSFKWEPTVGQEKTHAKLTYSYKEIPQYPWPSSTKDLGSEIDFPITDDEVLYYDPYRNVSQIFGTNAEGHPQAYWGFASSTGKSVCDSWVILNYARKEKRELKVKYVYRDNSSETVEETVEVVKDKDQVLVTPNQSKYNAKDYGIYSYQVDSEKEQDWNSSQKQISVPETEEEPIQEVTFYLEPRVLTFNFWEKGQEVTSKEIVISKVEEEKPNELWNQLWQDQDKKSQHFRKQDLAEYPKGKITLEQVYATPDIKRDGYLLYQDGEGKPTPSTAYGLGTGLSFKKVVDLEFIGKRYLVGTSQVLEFNPVPLASSFIKQPETSVRYIQNNLPKIKSSGKKKQASKKPTDLELAALVVNRKRGNWRLTARYGLYEEVTTEEKLDTSYLHLPHFTTQGETHVLPPIGSNKYQWTEIVSANQKKGLVYLKQPVSETNKVYMRLDPTAALPKGQNYQAPLYWRLEGEILTP
ncbi:lectin-like domain-containing protein [Vagococcus humatus]|uniref:WxL domain-containing protein n=1 Tax=Vagococcus humatus TaxID=1889241 RepID=A0A429Z843_9ENTE|nr:hypothetical protein [Vagococcus humatus]RST89864.1 hypothetical protein C7P63_01945 [Vagococcus humatus]